MLYTSRVPRAQGGSVLVVEDDADLRHFFRLALIVAGFHVREARDGYLALVAIEEDPPDVLVLDLGLPRVSGFSVLDELAARSDIPTPAVVVVTGLDGIDHLNTTVLHKPVEPGMLVNSVRRAMRRTAASPLA
jgi:DNA-binding response OmpR family regulator